MVFLGLCGSVVGAPGIHSSERERERTESERGISLTLLKGYRAHIVLNQTQQTARQRRLMPDMWEAGGQKQAHSSVRLRQAGYQLLDQSIQRIYIQSMYKDAGSPFGDKKI